MDAHFLPTAMSRPGHVQPQPAGARQPCRCSGGSGRCLAVDAGKPPFDPFSIRFCCRPFFWCVCVFVFSCIYIYIYTYESSWLPKRDLRNAVALSGRRLAKLRMEPDTDRLSQLQESDPPQEWLGCMDGFCQKIIDQTRWTGWTKTSKFPPKGLPTLMPMFWNQPPVRAWIRTPFLVRDTNKTPEKPSTAAISDPEKRLRPTRPACGRSSWPCSMPRPSAARK